MDYWLGDLPSADDDAVEQHLMTCDACGDRLRGVIALADGLRALARSGSLHVVISDRFARHAARDRPACAGIQPFPRRKHPVHGRG